MALFAKPDFNSVWAATGIKIKPENAKISQGWIVEIPPYEFDNWLINRQDSMLAHLNQMGIPVWDNATEYHGGKSYVQGASSGVIYRAVTTNIAMNPETDLNNNWAVAFQASGEALLKSQNLADVPNKALARQNLGISTTGDYDTRYLQRTNNLSDVPNKATGRANLDVYGRSETYTKDEIYAMSGVGMVSYFAGPTAPSGWLPADGRAVSRTQFAYLFTQIGTIYGAGNGTTTFNLPDLRGEFIRGWDAGRGVDAGRALHTWQSDVFASHTHSGATNTAGGHEHRVLANTSVSGDHNHWVNDPGHSHSVPGDTNEGYNSVDFDSGSGRNNFRVNTSPSATGIWLSNGGNHQHLLDTNTWGAGDHSHVLYIQNSGGNETRPRNIALLACIKV